MAIEVGIQPLDAEEAPQGRKRGAPKGSTKTRTPRFDRAQALKKTSIEQTGRLLSMVPTTPTDLAEQWQIGNDDAHGVSIKVLRQPKGEPMASAELVADIPLLDYSLARIAGKYGPGLYFVRGTGAWAQRACKLTVSAEYARESGFGVVEPARPTASDVMAMQTVARMEAGAPVQSVEMLSAIERIVEATIRKNQPKSMTPQVNIDSQFDQMFKWMGLMDRLEDRALKVAEKRLGVSTTDTEAAPETTGQMLMSLLPQALQVFGDMMKQRNTEPMRPVALPQRPTQPVKRVEPLQVQTKPTEAPQPPTNPQHGAPEMQLDAEEQSEEHSVLTLSKRLMGSFGADLAELADRPESDDDLGDEIGGLIPPMFYPNLVKLSGLVNSRGVEVLAFIHPALTSPRWAGILASMAKKINAQG